MTGAVAACLLLLVLTVPLAFNPTRSEVFAPVKIFLVEVLLGLGLLATALATFLAPLARSGTGFPPALRADAAVAGFAGLNVLACLHSLDRASSLHGQFPEYQGLATELCYVATYALARIALRDARQGKTLFAALTAVTGLVGGYAVAQRLGLDPLWGNVSRPFATVGHANNMAAVIVVTLPATVATVLSTRRLPRAAGFIAGGFGLAGLVVSLSRGGWLAATVGLLVAAALTPTQYRARAGLVIAGLVIAVTTALLLSPAGHEMTRQIAQRAGSLQDTSSGSVGRHLALTEVGLLVTIDHPWLGVGQDVFPQVAQAYADQHLAPARADLLRAYRPESPHNGLLETSAAAGIPALAVYLLALASAAAAALRSRRDHPRAAATLLVALLTHLVSGLFMTTEVSSEIIAWALMGAAVTLQVVPPVRRRHRRGRAACLADDSRTPSRTPSRTQRTGRRAAPGRPGWRVQRRS